MLTDVKKKEKTVAVYCSHCQIRLRNNVVVFMFGHSSVIEEHCLGIFHILVATVMCRDFCICELLVFDM